MSDIKPAIDDQFWFDRSGEMIKGAGERLDKWADQMREMIVWAYGIYTASSILTVEYKKIDEWWVLLLLGLPYIWIIFVYWKSQQVQLPIDVTFDEKAPGQIKKVYTAAYQEKSHRVSNLVRYSFVAIFSLAAALITALVVKNEQRMIPVIQKENYFNGIVQKKGENFALVLTGQFPADSILGIETTTILTDSVNKIIRSIDRNFSILNLRNGLYQQEYPVDSLAQKIIFSIHWNEGVYRKSLQREFIIKPPHISVLDPRLTQHPSQILPQKN